MGLLKNAFTWWEGATWGTALYTRRKGAEVGRDAFGNVYFESKKPDSFGVRRRWVMYSGSNDASRVAPEWHGWLHGNIDTVPEGPAKAWQKPPLGNTTGTRDAYRPAGALEAGGRRAAATGDYEAWTPDA
ncbi:NADH:ubiquinone oxidoreductase subunit NDUFA12 [Sphingomonas jatrophae]|uniref:NADH:ubiquinone oxidoreductase subunit n=1 Tax=Sphingomonas jatrophae TaxID=1166337 RepID=A0A1I6K9H0_9SPHN|nr:NADH:ubiquinone oxidoreductase subunit NDUFA12 [Sphingomonas jatrophae]SFR87872.1 NADH:ubiquinone oxidoreductase subunit [Sphingomonas jatrophae]